MNYSKESAPATFPGWAFQYWGSRAKEELLSHHDLLLRQSAYRELSYGIVHIDNLQQTSARVDWVKQTGVDPYDVVPETTQSGLQTIKVYPRLCLVSTDRVIQLLGDLGKVVDCLQAIAELLEGAPPNSSRQNCDARDYDESIVSEYGGWSVGKQNSATGTIRRHNNLSNAAYGQNNVIATGLFGGTGPGVTAAGRTGGPASAVTQVLAGNSPNASAAAMLAATGGQTAGSPNAGPAGDAVATAAASMAVGLMRGVNIPIQDYG
ncbi:Heterogeneous nuclear ribonucleoprotein K [Paragonimus skrjabini miyazakii]|uniref:Heterogeneous nuclear ribonucleoprotein K n=1 Tax=Paragonimus skrjabini miyazakii TaxID=59628 RepID=A0A8S9YE33_9TREM|nr:Heterogeneous nuclear ribonucleoprotein K [Paragonimus skrjabini miyazakii]